MSARIAQVIVEMGLPDPCIDRALIEVCLWPPYTAPRSRSPDSSLIAASDGAAITFTL